MVQSFFVSETPEVGDRIIGWLTDRPESRAVGVSSLAGLDPRAVCLILTYPVPARGKVVAAAGGVRVAKFREEEPRPG